MVSPGLEQQKDLICDLTTTGPPVTSALAVTQKRVRHDALYAHHRTRRLPSSVAIRSKAHLQNWLLMMLCHRRTTGAGDHAHASL
jgi:hypothetical protein